jgi:hypothetical protein
VKRSKRRGTKAGSTPSPQSSTTSRGAVAVGNPNLDGRPAVPEGVFEQVRRDAFERQRIGIQLEPVVDDDVHIRSAVRSDPLQHGLEAWSGSKSLTPHLERPGIELGEIEELFRQRAEPNGLLVERGAQILHLLGSQRRPSEMERRGDAVDGGDRRAELVRRDGDEVGHAVGLIDEDRGDAAEGGEEIEILAWELELRPLPVTDEEPQTPVLELKRDGHDRADAGSIDDRRRHRVLGPGIADEHCAPRVERPLEEAQIR